MSCKYAENFPKLTLWSRYLKQQHIVTIEDYNDRLIKQNGEFDMNVTRNVIGEPPPIPDLVNHPKHYTSHPSGIECIQVTEHMGFNIGNAMKYLWRADEKGAALQDLRKALWYVQREIDKRGGI